ncbi:hypothetical protein BH11ARM1_BH11ARM1_07600 [soil metagenome]
MAKMTSDYIAKLVATGEFAEVYRTAADLETFTIGVFLAVNKDQYVLATIDDNNAFGGYDIGKLDSIISVVTLSEYVAEFEMPETKEVAPELASTLHETLASLVESRDLVTFVYDYQGIESWFGNLVQVDEETILAQTYTEDGDADGLRLTRLRDLVRVETKNADIREFATKIATATGNPQR